MLLHLLNGLDTFVQLITGHGAKRSVSHAGSVERSVDNPLLIRAESVVPAYSIVVRLHVSVTGSRVLNSVGEPGQRAEWSRPSGGRVLRSVAAALTAALTAALLPVAPCAVAFIREPR